MTSRSPLAAFGLDGSTLTALLASRAVQRGAFGVAPLVLTVAWSGDRFDRYVAAVAPFIVAGPLLTGGIEKSLLKLVPRRDDDRAGLVRLYLLIAGAGAGLLLLWGAVVASWSRDVLLVAAACAFTTATGVLQLTAGMQRALGRPMVEVAVQVGLGLGMGTAMLAGVAGAGPRGVLTGLAAASVGGAAVSVLLVTRACPGRLARDEARPVLRDVVLQGGTDVLTGVAVTAVLLMTGGIGPDGSGEALYVAISVIAVMSGAYTYLMRLAQPAIARRHGTAPPVVGFTSRRALVLTPAAAAGGLAALLLVGRAVGRDLEGLAATAVAVSVLLLQLPLIVAAAALHFLFENAGREQLHTTVRAAAVAFVGVMVSAPPLIAYAGAVGALTALAVGELVHLTILLAARRPGDRPRPGRPA